MNKLVFVISIIFLIGLNLKTNAQSKQGLPSNSVDSKKWVEQHFAKGKIPPFSFLYGGKSSDTFIKSWQYQAVKLKSKEPNAEETQYTYTDQKSGLVVKCSVTCFTDFPSVEWVLKFSNTSGTTTPILEKASVINFAFKAGTKGNFVLHHAKGSNAERADFQPLDENLEAEKSIYMTPSGGRSSDHTAFPFFNIEMPGQQGIMVAVGWTGKWFADVLQADDKSVSLKSGMEKMHLVLNPKEEIRTPKICLLFWKGDDRMIGHNQFRQFILAHHSRKIDGKFAEYPLSGSFDYGDPAPCGEYECLTEEFATALVKRYKQFDILPEVFWLDAGWYTGCNGLVKGGQWHQNVGNWTVEKTRFPNGLKPVADAVHQTGAKFMVWFEPERVMEGTQLFTEHPEWLIKLPKSKNSLFDLGNDQARIWLTDYISGFLKKEGIDYYRQDFNFDPKPYWDANDQPDRVGISEIKHIEGLYAFWDSLLVRFPKLLIDNCASGGRRLDLETTSRSTPLWRTDYQYGEPNGYQCHTYGLNFYLPIHGTAIYKTDGYTFRSGLGGTAVMNWEVTGKNSEPIPAIQKRIQDYKNIRPYFYADYYPLTASENNAGDDVWLAYQLNRPKENDGVVIAFRRNNCSIESISVKLKGLDKSADYELTDDDTGTKIIQKGAVLCNGFTLSLAEKQKSLQINYKKVKN
jgi:alpha-galactosidase